MTRFWPKVWTSDALSATKAIRGVDRLGTGFGKDGGLQRQGEFTSIDGGSSSVPIVAYEFFTSEHFGNNANGSYGWEQLPGPLTPETAPALQGSWTRMRVRGRSATVAPIFSYTFEPGEGDSWGYNANARLDPDIPPVATGAAGYNRQRAQEHAVWHENGAMTFSTAAMARGMGGMLGRYSCHHFFRFENTWTGMSDIGQDVAPTRIDAIRSATGKRITGLRHRAAEPVFDQEWVFSRHATSRVVDGTLFFIATDNFGRIYVYKAGDPVEPGQYRPRSTYWVGYPPYPAWVTVPDVGDQWALNRTWLWEFNSDATKAVCCPWNSTEGPLFRIGNNWGVLSAARLAEIDTSSYATSSVRPDEEDVPGLVEIGIEIVNEGPGDGEFDVTLTLLRSDFMGASGRFIFHAAYSLPDKTEAGMAGGDEPLPTDTLMTAELELLAPAGGYAPGPAAPYGTTVDPLLTDIVKWGRIDLILAHNDATMSRNELRRLVLFENYKGAAMTPASFGTWMDMAPAIASQYGSPTTMATVYPKAGAPEEAVEAVLGAISTVDVFEPSPAVPGGIQAYRAGFITSLELRTCSIRYDQQDTFDGVYRSLLIHQNEVQAEFEQAYFTKPVPDDYPAGPWSQVGGLAHLQMQLGFSMSVSHWAGFSVHPRGHWAIGGGQYNYEAEEEQVTNDVIQPYRGERTSHRAAFNEAWGQARSANYYTWTTEFETDASLLVPKSTTDRGSFRVAGHWFDFTASA